MIFTVVETVHYEVEAESAEAAIEAIIADGDRDKLCVGVLERYAVAPDGTKTEDPS